MIILGTNSVKAAGGFNVDNSVRLDGTSSFVRRTNNSSASSSRIMTISWWMKRCKNGSEQKMYTAQASSGNRDTFLFTSDDKMLMFLDNASPGNLRTNRLFRDNSAWYNIVWRFDTTQGTASNRVKLYVNGVEETSFDSGGDGIVYPSRNYDIVGFGQNGKRQTVGADDSSSSSGNFFSGYFAQFCFCDGQSLGPDSFGEFDSDSGIWKPIDVSGLTFGNNGFFLDFADSGDLGDDESGNGNDFAETGLAATDQSTDTCTNNFATWNNLLGIQIPDTFSEGNLVLTMGQNAWRTTFSTIAASSGKFYAEVKWVTGSEFTAGFGNAQSYSVDQDLNDLVANPGGDGYVSVIYKNGALYENGSNTGSGYSTYSSGNIIMLAMDLDNYKLYLGVNGTWGNSANPATNSNGVAIPSANQGDFFHFAVSTYGNTQASGNFGSPAFAISSGNTDGNGYGNFEYAVPSGYFSLNTKNLAEYG